MGRAPCCEKVGLKRGRWTTEEDDLLVNYIRANGEGSWRSLPKNAGLLRCGKSCRLRWINYLRSDVKRGNITKEEEDTILKLHSSIGNRWSLIASHLPGRTDNEIKNYWNSHLSRRVHNTQKTVDEIDKLKLPKGSKRRGGRTSRSSMKKKNNSRSCAKGKHEHDRHENCNDVISSEVSTMQSDEGHSMTSNVTFEGQNEVVMDPTEGMESAILFPSPSPGPSPMDSGLWTTNIDELEALLFNGSHDMSPSDEAAAVNEVNNGAMQQNSKDAEMVEFDKNEVEKLLDWDLEGMEMEAELWNDEGNMWPWLWDNNEIEDLGCGYHEEPLASWLTSDVF